MSAGETNNSLQNGIHQQRIPAESSQNTKGSSLFKMLTQKLGVLGVLPMSDQSHEKSTTTTTTGTQTFISSTSNSIMDHVRREADCMAKYVIHTFGEENTKTPPPNKYCETISRTVKELSIRHAMVFKGIVKKLDTNDDSIDIAVQTFVVVADELFDEGQVNWGRIVSVYAFAAHLAKHIVNKNDSNPRSMLIKDEIASFVGQYVAGKLGQWIVDHGGWDAFVEYFPDPEEFEAKVWKIGLLTAIGLGAMATVIATR